MAKIARLQTADSMIPFEAETTHPGRVRVIVDGLSPLLTHNPESMGVSNDAKKGGRIPDPETEAEAGVYRLADGTCGIKGEAFRASLLKAAGAWKMKRSTAASRLAHVTVVQELLPLLRRDGTPISDYAIDRRRAIVVRAGIVRARPRFDEWSVDLTFQYDPILVDEPKLILNILQDAGGRVGVGDYRPGTKGWFGRFTVRSYQVL